MVKSGYLCSHHPANSLAFFPIHIACITFPDGMREGDTGEGGGAIRESHRQATGKGVQERRTMLIIRLGRIVLQQPFGMVKVAL